MIPKFKLDSKVTYRDAAFTVTNVLIQGDVFYDIVSCNDKQIIELSVHQDLLEPCSDK